MFEHIFKKGNLDVSVFPYKTISNRTGTENNIGGIIEVIKDSQSRDEIGKIYGIKLDEFFLHKFGEVHS
jgi:phosphatidylinositol 4-kinase